MNKPSTETAQTEHPLSSALPPWWECDLFCIHSYAGEAGSPCGWRGRSIEAREGRNGRNDICPRCGRPTLLPIPPRPSKSGD